MSYDSHLTLDALELHLLSRLSKGESAQMEGHLFTCAKCGAMAAELMQQIKLIQAAFAFDCES